MVQNYSTLQRYLKVISRLKEAGSDRSEVHRHTGQLGNKTLKEEIYLGDITGEEVMYWVNNSEILLAKLSKTQEISYSNIFILRLVLIRNSNTGFLMSVLPILPSISFCKLLSNFNN